MPCLLSGGCNEQSICYCTCIAYCAAVVMNIKFVKFLANWTAFVMKSQFVKLLAYCTAVLLKVLKTGQLCGGSNEGFGNSSTVRQF